MKKTFTLNLPVEVEVEFATDELISSARVIGVRQIGQVEQTEEVFEDLEQQLDAMDSVVLPVTKEPGIELSISMSIRTAVLRDILEETGQIVHLTHAGLMGVPMPEVIVMNCGKEYEKGDLYSNSPMADHFLAGHGMCPVCHIELMKVYDRRDREKDTDSKNPS